MLSQKDYYKDGHALEQRMLTVLDYGAEVNASAGYLDTALQAAAYV